MSRSGCSGEAVQRELHRGGFVGPALFSPPGGALAEGLHLFGRSLGLRAGYLTV